MPKMKTKKAVAARFKVTGTGKLKFNRPGRRHIMTKKSSKRKRQLRAAGMLDECRLKTYKHMMCA